MINEVTNEIKLHPSLECNFGKWDALRKGLNEYTISEWEFRDTDTELFLLHTAVDNTENAEIGVNGYDVEFYPLSNIIRGYFYNSTSGIQKEAELSLDKTAVATIRNWIEGNQIFDETDEEN